MDRCISGSDPQGVIIWSYHCSWSYCCYVWTSALREEGICTIYHAITTPWGHSGWLKCLQEEEHCRPPTCFQDSNVKEGKLLLVSRNFKHGILVALALDSTLHRLGDKPNIKEGRLLGTWAFMTWALVSTWSIQLEGCNTKERTNSVEDIKRINWWVKLLAAAATWVAGGSHADLSLPPVFPYLFEKLLAPSTACISL